MLTALQPTKGGGYIVGGRSSLDISGDYPNPTADGRIRVQLAAGSLNLAGTTQQLDFDFSSQLPAAGLYYLRLEDELGQQVLKMVRE